MKPSWFPTLLLVPVAALLAQPKKIEPMRGAKLDESKPAVATLLVGANETVGSIAEPGWPIIVSAAREPDDAAPASTPPTGLRVKVTDAKDAVVEIAFTPVPRPDPAGPDESLYWLAAESATTRLGPGKYRVTLVSATGDVPGWRIDAGLLQIVAPNPERAGLLGALKIQRSLLLGREDEALAEADRLIAANANDAQAWITKGDLLLMKDQPEEALKAYDSALKLQEPAEGDPVDLLERRRRAFLRRLEKRGAIPVETPP